MAVVGIVMRSFQLVISITVGTAAGCIPIVGYNIGAGRRDRVRSLFTRLLLAEALAGAAALLIVELFPQRTYRELSPTGLDRTEEGHERPHRPFHSDSRRAYARRLSQSFG